MNRLVAVSNRVGPVRGAAVAGGLAVGLVEALRKSGGLWLGASTHLGEPKLHKQKIEGLTLATLDLPRDEYEDYYNGYANRCLWPLFHFRIDLVRFERKYLDAYQAINRHFADALKSLLKPDDLVWVHDYHLFPLAGELRARGLRQRLGFFLHIPFPPPDLLVTLPGHEQLVRWLFDYDVVGFQTAEDLRRFTAYVEQIAGGTVWDGRVRAFGRSIIARAYPIGIDAAQFREMALCAEGERECERMRAALRGRDLMIGVDRLDYSKGLLRRMSAYELMLQRDEEAQRAVEFLQIAPLSRGELKAYADFRDELDHAAARINGRFAQTDWTPVRYLNRALPRRALAGLYRAARIGVVTPMRDGMNLVAKEYIAAQDADDPGVLVLSKFAGAAQQMKAALLVNPYDIEQMADALQRARRMPLVERRQRHAELMTGLARDDVQRWRDGFVSDLAPVRARRKTEPAAARTRKRTPHARATAGR